MTTAGNRIEGIFKLECCCSTSLQGKTLEQIWPPYDCLDMCPYCEAAVSVCAIPTDSSELEVEVGSGMARHMEEECEVLPIAGGDFSEQQAESMRAAAVRMYNRADTEEQPSTASFQQHHWFVACGYCEQYIEGSHDTPDIFPAICSHLMTECSFLKTESARREAAIAFGGDTVAALIDETMEEFMEQEDVLLSSPAVAATGAATPAPAPKKRPKIVPSSMLCPYCHEAVPRNGQSERKCMEKHLLVSCPSFVPTHKLQEQKHSKGKSNKTKQVAEVGLLKLQQKLVSRKAVKGIAPQQQAKRGLVELEHKLQVRREQTIDKVLADTEDKLTQRKQKVQSSLRAVEQRVQMRRQRSLDSLKEIERRVQARKQKTDDVLLQKEHELAERRLLKWVQRRDAEDAARATQEQELERELERGQKGEREREQGWGRRDWGSGARSRHGGDVGGRYSSGRRGRERDGGGGHGYQRQKHDGREGGSSRSYGKRDRAQCDIEVKRHGGGKQRHDEHDSNKRPRHRNESY